MRCARDVVRGGWEPRFPIRSRPLSWLSGISERISNVRPEVHKAISIIQTDEQHAVERALATYAQGQKQSAEEVPAFHLAQILSARATRILQEKIIPKHAMCHEMLVAARQNISSSQQQKLDVVQVSDECAWPALPQQHCTNLADCYLFAKGRHMFAELQIAGFGAAVGNDAWQAEYFAGDDLVKDACAKYVCSTVLDTKAGPAKGEIADPMFKVVLLQNYELMGVSVFDRFALGACNFALMPYLLPMGVRIAQAMNLAVASQLNELQQCNQKLQNLDNARPIGPLHPSHCSIYGSTTSDSVKDRAWKELEGMQVEPMRNWSKARSSGVQSALAGFCTMTQLLARELADKGGNAGLAEARQLVVAAVPHFRIDSFGLDFRQSAPVTPFATDIDPGDRSLCWELNSLLIDIEEGRIMT